MRHIHVKHATELREAQDKPEGRVAKANDWLASHLSIVFGLAWTVWLFFIVPLVAPYLGAAAETKIFFYSSGWIQLFALPLMIYVGNKLQRSSDAQSAANFEAMTHIANTVDELAKDVGDLKAKYLA